jgi:hypothetical protein
MTTSVIFLLEVLANTTRPEKEIRGIEIQKGLQVADDQIVDLGTKLKPIFLCIPRTNQLLYL